jgi:hypothetical protein
MSSPNRLHPIFNYNGPFEHDRNGAPEYPQQLSGIEGFRTIVPGDSPADWEGVRSVLPAGVRIELAPGNEACYPAMHGVRFSEPLPSGVGMQVGESIRESLAHRVVANRLGSKVLSVTTLHFEDAEVAKKVRGILPGLGFYGGVAKNLSCPEAKNLDEALTVAALPEPTPEALQMIFELLGMEVKDLRNLDGVRTVEVNRMTSQFVELFRNRPKALEVPEAA